MCQSKFLMAMHNVIVLIHGEQVEDDAGIFYFIPLEKAKRLSEGANPRQYTLWYRRKIESKRYSRCL
jgi:hypothetical protein